MSFLLRVQNYIAPAVLLLTAPFLAVAGEPNLGYFGDGSDGGIVGEFGNLVDIIIPVLFALALLLFVWGVINYFILGAGDEGKRETGRSYMLYAIIGLVAITAVWGIVNLLTEILGVDSDSQDQTITRPGVPQPR